MRKKLIRVINGQKVPIDRHIADLICLMNERGYSTRWCCSGVKEDHNKKETTWDEYGFGARFYIRCLAYKYNPEKVGILLWCLDGIGNLQYHTNEHGEFLDIEFFTTFSDSNLKSKDRIKLFYTRFKEKTDEQTKQQIQKQTKRTNQNGRRKNYLVGAFGSRS